MEEIVLVTPTVGNNFLTARETTDQFHVDFNFCCDLFVYESYDDVALGRNVQYSFMTKSVRMDIKQLMDSQISRRMMNQELREWPLPDEDHRDLFEFAMDAVKVLVRDMPPQHNVLVIPFNVLVLCKRRVNVNDLAMAGQSIDEADSQMVPATDSSIDSLEFKTANLHENEDDSCSICLEDFYSGPLGVLSMPCSHIFHEDCIKKWLKSSHYCPICRFQMPTFYDC